MDVPTLLAGIDFARARLIGILDAIERSGQNPAAVLAWRPGPGRAHIAWQAMHCAATHDRYLNVRIRGGAETDPDLVKRFAGGSTPSDDDVPALATVREKLATHLHQFREYVSNLSPADLARSLEFPNNVRRTVGESIVLLTWHEAHHQGQIHLTWNMYKAAHGVK
ncbi:MAG TPA: DinB family protein [Tepidisphaeraceae bacterium]|nr:DinB family protein [Tepidisphaeraceae bacterium]